MKKMNRIDALFQRKRHDVLSLYFCAGCPTLDGTAGVVRALESEGVDMVEVGIPFSDPLADGPVIQDASTRALRNGMSLRLLFRQLEGLRPAVRMPIVLMGYLNPIMQYGFEAFCRSCQACGVDGMIIPDLPFRDYVRDYRPVAEKYGLHVIMLVTPETSDERIRAIDENTGGFVYMVSSASVTGARHDFDAARLAYFRHVGELALRHPCLVGFGISNKQTYETAAAHSAGCIIGSRFVTLLDEEQGDAVRAVRRLRELLAQ